MLSSTDGQKSKLYSNKMNKHKSKFHFFIGEIYIDKGVCNTEHGSGLFFSYSALVGEYDRILPLPDISYN